MLMSSLPGSASEKGDSIARSDYSLRLSVCSLIAPSDVLLNLSKKSVIHLHDRVRHRLVPCLRIAVVFIAYAPPVHVLFYEGESFADVLTSCWQ